MATLWAEKQRQNIFTIELFDQSGKRCTVSPESINYTIGLTITDPPLTHNIGVATANNEVDVFFEKGTPLPAKTKRIHQAVVGLKRNSAGGRLTIPFVEGDFSEANLNRKIGFYEIRSDQISRDIPVGSEIEIKLELDSSRLVKGSIYVPILDMEFPLTIEGLVKTQPDLLDMRRDFENQKQKLRELQSVVSTCENPKLAEVLNDLNREEPIESIERLLVSADDDENARTCETRLLDLKAAVRKMEVQIQFPKLVQEATDEIELVNQTLEAHGTAEDQSLAQLLIQEVELAIRADDTTLERKIVKLFQFRIRILMRTPGYWVGYRDYLLDRKTEMLDATQAELWFSHAGRAINNGDIEALRSACNQLRALLPVVHDVRGYGGNTVKSRNTR
jgi:molecular chaperone DnaK